MSNSLFEQLVLWLFKNRLEFTISTGIAYGHKMYKHNGYEFVEFDDNTVSVYGDHFRYKVTTTHELIKLLEATH